MKTAALAIVTLLAFAVGLISCGPEEIVRSDDASPPIWDPHFDLSGLQQTLFPNEDLTPLTWNARPLVSLDHWSTLDEGVGDRDEEYIDACQGVEVDRLGFSNLSGFLDVTVTEIEFSLDTHLIPCDVSVSPTTTFLDLRYFINDVQQGFARLARGPGSVWEGDSLWVVTFTSLSYDLAEINSLEIEVEMLGGDSCSPSECPPGCPGLTTWDIHAIDASVVFDCNFFGPLTITSKEIVATSTCDIAYVRFTSNVAAGKGTLKFADDDCFTNVTLVNATRIGSTFYASFDKSAFTDGDLFWDVTLKYCGFTDASSCDRKRLNQRSPAGCPPPSWWPF